MKSIFLFVAVLLIASTCEAFVQQARSLNRLTHTRPLFALEPEVVEKLEEITGKYERLANVDSPESEDEASKLKETAEKYGTYLEVKKMITKVRTMYVNEASDRRKSRMLKSFIDLYKGKVEIEQILREKAGFPSSKAAEAEGLAQLAKLDAEIASLEEKLQVVAVKIPEGKSTRMERFGDAA
mmetsp:Transcript_27685/g.46538  ORF Transcript_27685/g.46538 Transcript_27685/m.46538 type:complete len:183 (+) Transcript_27685:67-615(+)